MCFTRVQKKNDLCRAYTCVGVFILHYFIYCLSDCNTMSRSHLECVCDSCIEAEKERKKPVKHATLIYEAWSLLCELQVTEDKEFQQSDYFGKKEKSCMVKFYLREVVDKKIRIQGMIQTSGCNYPFALNEAYAPCTYFFYDNGHIARHLDSRE